MTDFRKLCREMYDAFTAHARTDKQHDLLDRVQGALAQPEPEGRPAQAPADGEVAELVAWLRERWPHMARIPNSDYAMGVRAADLLERQAAPVPVAVSERLPGAEDCDAEHCCWRWNPNGGLWAKQPLTRSWYKFETHWLPAHALPLPTPEPQP